MEEQKTAKTFDELNKFERAMATATLEGKLEGMANDLKQISQALKIAIHIDANYYDWENKSGVCVAFIGDGKDQVTNRSVENPCDLFGIIEEALAKTNETSKE